MTKYLKMLMAGLIGLVVVTPALADCGPRGSFQAMVDDLKTVNGAKMITVTPEKFKSFVDKFGPPPGTDMEKPFEVYILTSGGIAVMKVVQDGCVTIDAGPAPLNNFLMALGFVDA